MIDNGTAAGTAEMYNNASITAAMSGATDNGLTFGASFSVRTGDDVDLDVGDLGNNDNTKAEIAATSGNQDNDGAFNQLSDINFGNIFVTGAWGTLTFDRGGIDNLMDDGFSHDVSYAYTMGGLSIGVTADLDSTTGTKGGEDYSMSIVYTAAPTTVTVKTDDSGDYDATLAYAVNDMMGVSLNYDTDGQEVNSVVKAETTLKVTLKEGDVSGHVAYADDEDDQWEIGLGYSANNLTLGATLGEDGLGTDTKSRLTASYNLGGGMSINAATNEAGAYFVGAALKF